MECRAGRSHRSRRRWWRRCPGYRRPGGYGPREWRGVRSAIVAKLVFVNGKIVTVDERFSVRQAVAVADGRIIAVGRADEALAAGGAGAAGTALRGAAGRPGVVDEHMHSGPGAV